MKKASFIGNVTGEPRKTDTYGMFSIAVNSWSPKTKTETADFFNIFVNVKNEYQMKSLDRLSKGDKVYVEASISNNQKTKQSAYNLSSLEIVSKYKGGTSAPTDIAKTTTSVTPKTEVQTNISVDDIPF